MASFSLTYNRIIKSDIKHTHFGKPFTMQFRNTENHPALEQIRQQEESARFQAKNRRVKSSVYRNYDIAHAPAFESVDAKDVDEIVKRLRTPTAASRAAAQKSEAQATTEKGESDGKKKIGAEEEETLVKRLSSPTHTSKMRAERDPHKVITQINGSIESGSLLVTQPRD